MTRCETGDRLRRVGFLVLSILTVVVAQLLWLLPVASAQSIFASLSGTVRDTSGAVVAGADITVVNEASGVVRKAVTGQDGFFSMTYLPAPASYRVLVVAKGFRKWQGTGIALNSDDSRTMNNIELPVGAPTETVEVVSATQEIAVVDSGEKSAIISSKDLQNLSLVGRNATEYLKLLPGAALQANGGVNRPAYDGQVVGINGFATGASGAAGLSANTINGQSIEITQDGQHSFDPGAPGAATPVNPNPNMISEVKVLTSNFTSENIKGPVVVNTVTKSGGSTFHGEGYIYARNQAMNAEDAFNRQTEVQNGLAPGFLKVPSSYYFPGGNIGGPLYIPGTGFNKSRKKFFFFEGFELYRQDLDGGVDRSFVPTDAMLGGDFSALSQPQYANVGHSTVAHVPTTPAPGTRLGWDGPSGRVSHSFGGPCTGITGGVIDPGCIDPNAQALLRSYLPEPNADPSVSGFNYVQAFTVPQHSWQNVVRGDVNITDSTKAFITWSRQRETANMPMGLWNNSGDWTVPAPSNAVGANGSDSVSGTLLHVFSPTMVNETRFGYTKVNFPTSLTNPAKQTRAGVGFPLTGIFGNPNTPAVLSWGSTFPNLGDVGHAYHPTLIAVKGIPSVADNLTKVIKTHTLKTGFYYEHVYNKQDNWGQFMGVYAYGATGWGGGTSGNEYADALMGIGTAGYFEQAAPPPTNLAQNIAAFYVQDDWKLTRRITVQYGMRFEHYAKPYSDPFGLAVFNPSKYDASIDPNLNTQTGISWHSLDHSIPISGAKSRLFYYSPRVGAAIDLFGTGRTVVRGGWGRYRSYDSVQSNSYVQPAQTATGSSSWSCNWNDSACPTWEDVDQHALPKPVYGQGLPPGANKGVFVIDPSDDEQPLTTSYSLTVDQQLPGKFRMELSYVGNNTEFLQGYTNLFNGIPLGTITQQARVDFAADCNAGGNDSLGSTACLAHFRKYPDYTTINTSVTAGKAQYDSLQVSLNRNVGFLTLQANYTWAKALGNGAVFSNGGLPAALSISNAEHYLRGILPNDRAHALSLAYVFNLPSLRSGSGFVKSVANGWQISGITQVQSGAQIATQGGTNLNFNLNQGNIGPNQDNVHLLGSPDITLYPVITCNPTKGLKKNQFINPDCFAPAPVGQLGTGGIPYIPGPLFWNSDLTLIKNFRLTERQGLQFRFAAFNFLNHDLLSFVNNDNNLKLTFDANGKANSNFGVATSHVGRRLIELGVKYTF
jgi:hypothetical protein